MGYTELGKVVLKLQLCGVFVGSKVSALIEEHFFMLNYLKIYKLTKGY